MSGAPRDKDCDGNPQGKRHGHQEQVPSAREPSLATTECAIRLAPFRSAMSLSIRLKTD